jgi:CheY-specific phosphatase CheX
MTRVATPQAIEESVAEVLDRMFFAESVPDVAVDCGKPDSISMSVEFRGAALGRITVTVSAESAQRLAADFLGIEEAASADGDTVTAVIGELTNMVCGAVLSRKSSGPFTLGTPPRNGCGEGEKGICRSFDLGDGGLRVCLEYSGSGEAEE